ncbi:MULTISPECIES: ligase-associated DNA damage response endonuclease PdeM [unclassified Sinorhizobium]|uniref:ligase-associated DNA damage response endonuclease PdeM n=1 Tax=unclassified Sinorhizobium TaxID=2613772 RepID=UPI0024C27574|nr:MULTISPECIES: ligase-associated DNA damage response endonuclease PdeM [unclassified Sinorhizobium]MDK1377753.1 ligase-associated DNA damage response endonuclease PdeM [Sinorhizobium sp. 6-70]MDK1478713.1 ligase-associated DNA damage response endonuclease PdeM [Sinorhizobium sp. 6-117]
MHRLVHAISPPAADGFFQSRMTVDGVVAICDPLGGLYLPESRTLVVSDLHLEKGSAFARRGMMLPPYDTLATLRILEAVVARHNPATVVSLGDNFHDRKGSAAMPETFRHMVAAMARGREWIWINGNHDPDGASGLPGTSMDELRHAGLIFRHEPSRGEGIGEIAGHLHPAATVRRREKSVRRACFATDGRRLVMPAFGVTTGGLDLRHRAMSGLFDRQQLVAHMLGRDRIYSVRFANLLG